MSAARATGNRRPPAFKPPRPAGKSTINTARRKDAADTSRTAVSQPRSSVSGSNNSGFKPASRTIPISDDEEEGDLEDAQDTLEADHNDDDDSDTSLPAAPRNRLAKSSASPSAAAPQASQDAPPPIPQKLLTRLLYEGFEDKKTKIGKDAMTVVGKYMEIFVREAIARAAMEREGESGGGLGDEFLEVEDLEKLAPQLLLDF
ncbi:hypothetical protein EV356DRAFT_519859 [Viridothelium virens]|uniref:Centromere protein X n=1 Tax=Viridothelium virens TaxID=1048519 RepID=A0A6A6GXJ7_VIRVR|nr:hypothetical protein EV356DRAFT_519859 [Viridothelium virens]